MPQESMATALRELCFMQLNPICQLIEQDTVLVKGTKTDPVLWLDRLSSVLRYINVTVREGKLILEYFKYLTLQYYRQDHCSSIFSS